MSKDRRAVDRILGLLMPLGPVRARAMFGGWGIYLDDIFFALIADDQLFLKVDSDSEARFVAAGAEPFIYSRGGDAFAMSYREAPAGSLDDPGALLPWAELALAAARRARKGKSKKTKKTKSGKRGRPAR